MVTDWENLPDNQIPWIMGYRTRQWTVYGYGAEDEQRANVPQGLSEWIYNSEGAIESRSEEAERDWATRWAKDERLYIDLEIEAAGINEDFFSGGYVGRLRKEWNGHPQHTLVILVFLVGSGGKRTWLVQTSPTP